MGLSFKSETDDLRDSLSIKLLKQLKSRKIKTFQSDEYYKHKNNIDKKLLVKKSDIIIVSTPHKAYKNLKIGKNKILVDIWGFIEKNSKILLIGGSGNLGSSIIKSELFENLYSPDKKILI